MTHIPFNDWSAVALIAGGVALLGILSGPIRRHLRRLISCIGLGLLAATAITAWAYKRRPAAFTPVAGHAGHAVSTTTALVSAFAGITLAVALLAFVVVTVAARRRRPEPQYRHSPPGRRRRDSVEPRRRERSWR